MITDNPFWDLTQDDIYHILDCAHNTSAFFESIESEDDHIGMLAVYSQDSEMLKLCMNSLEFETLLEFKLSFQEKEL